MPHELAPVFDALYWRFRSFAQTLELEESGNLAHLASS
jgi:hypothetical protein